MWITGCARRGAIASAGSVDGRVKAAFFRLVVPHRGIFRPAPMQTDILSVSELLRSVRDTLERRFPLLWVRGEVSNLSRPGSGHCYFTLKDGAAQVDCVMFRSRLAAVDWPIAEGDRVEAR